MKAVVTGGAGFIGSHLVDRLLADGYSVTVVDDLSSGRLQNIAHLDGQVELVKASIRDLDALNTAFKGAEIVLHQAAVPSVPRSIKDPFASHEANATGTLNVLSAARNVEARKVVVASSSSVYGASEELPKREHHPVMPISPYGVSKLTGETYCRAFYSSYGLPAIALRYFNVFGPRQDPTSAYAAVIPAFITAALQGQPATINGDGEQSRDFTYISNVVDANMAAVNSEANCGAFNVACGGQFTLNELVSEISNVLGTPVDTIHGPARTGDIRHSNADISLAQDQLGYEPKIGFTEGLQKTADALRLELDSESKGNI